jgi:regulator of cell morphogenesis and NO signaling
MAQPPPLLDPAGDASPLPVELDALTRHIVETHHRYVREASASITVALDALTEACWETHGELRDVRKTFFALTSELLAHMFKEEHVLFPFIDELACAARAGTRPPAGPFGTIVHPVRVMEGDHQRSIALAERLRSLLHDFAVPAGVPQGYAACCAALARFDEDLYRHIAIENDTLFPAAVDLESRLLR